MVLTSKELNFVCSLIYNGLKSELPSIHKLNVYLDAMVKLLSKLGIAFTWITPSGITIKLAYLKFESIRTATSVLTNARPITIAVPTKTIDVRKSSQALMSNLIHSLDASNIHLLADLLKEKKLSMPFYTVHDCYAALPHEMRDIEVCVKEAFIKIYFSDSGYLNKLHAHLFAQLKSLSGFGERINDNGVKEFYVTTNDGVEMPVPAIPFDFDDDEVLLKQYRDGIMSSQFFLH